MNKEYYSNMIGKLAKIRTTKEENEWLTWITKKWSLNILNIWLT